MRTIAALKILLPAATSLVCSVHAATWWVAGSNDVVWTNKPIEEVSREAKGTNALAKFYLARAAFYGTGREADAQAALALLTDAAEQGLPDAQFMLSRFYMSGTATAANPRQGAAWAERAASAGHADAQAMLGDAYARGFGVGADTSKAHAYFRRAIEGGSVWALDWYGHFLMNGENGDAIKTNHSLALQYFERAASNGLTHSASHAVEFYRKGLGTPPNEERALFWARYAADQFDIEMMETLSRLYDEGLGEPRSDNETATELLRRVTGARAARLEQQQPGQRTSRNLATLTRNTIDLTLRYRFGIGTARDYISFAQWLLVGKRAADWGEQLRSGRPTTAEPHLFRQIVEGTTAITSIEDERIREAVHQVDQALQRGDAAACRKIGEAYRTGSSLTPQSPSLAWLWLNRAAELKDVQAAAQLAEVEKALSADQINTLKNRYLPATAPSAPRK